MKSSQLVVVIVLSCVFIFPYLIGVFAYSNQAPIASFTYAPTIPTPDETIVFNASASYDPDGYIIRYKWNFGDGNITIVSSPIVTYSYPVDGNYTVELTVTDNNGATRVAVAVVEVSTVAFFRVCFFGSLIPVPNVEVTAYYNNGHAWVKAPVGPHGFEIKYDLMTQPDLANTHEEKYRNPGTTASILRYDASNIGFDLHPSLWTVFFKFQWGSHIVYWPNETSRVFSYKYGAVETHYYSGDHQAYWDASAGTYVIKVRNIPKNGVAPTECHPIIVGILCPPPTQKYYLTVRTDPAGITTIPGEGWYTKDTNAVLTATEYVTVSSDTRYKFNYWDVNGASQGVGVNPITVLMNANHTATAHYVTQYSVIFTQSGLSSDATGNVVTIDGASKTFGDLPFTKWVDGGGSVSYSYSSPVSSSVSGKRFRLNSVSGPGSPITVAGPITVTGNYVIQYSVTFAQTGLDSTATGTVVTVNSVSKTYPELPYSFWADCGSSVSYTYSSMVSSTVTGKRFNLVAVHCPPSQFIVTGPVTITGEYCTQYSVTFMQSGLDSTATGTVVTVNGGSKTYSDLPYAFWVDSGSSVTYSYSSVVSSTVSGKQFRLGSVSGPSTPITVTSPTTVTGVYLCQYRITFAQSGLDSTATGTVVTVNSVTKTYSDLPYSFWADAGNSVTYSYSSPVSSSVSGKRFRLNSVSGSTSPFTVTGTATVTGNYVTQYSVTFMQSGLDSTATGTVVTVNGGSKTYSDLPYAFWVDSGSSVTYSYSSVVSSTVSGKQFRLGSVSGPASPMSVSGSTTVIGNYIVQYEITFTHTGLDSTATGTIVTANGDSKLYTELPYSIWVDSGSSVTYTYNSIVLSTVSGKRFQLTSVTGPSSPITVSGSTTVTGNYKAQYQITFDQTGVGTDFSGTVLTLDSIGYAVSGLPVSFWWDTNSNHNFAFVSPLVVNASKQYSWSSTSGLTTLQSETLTITTSGNVIGNYMVGNRIIFDQTGVSSDFTGTVLIVDSTPYGVNSLPVSFIWQVGSVHNFAYQSPLIVSANAKQYIWTSTSGLSTQQSSSITVTTFGSIIGNYKTQYYLTLATNPPGLDNPTGTGWYDANTYASISTDQYVPGGSRYAFTGWTTADMSEITDPLSTSTTVFVDKAKTVTANYVHQYLVTFKQTGLASDASGTVVTVNSSAKTYTDMPFSIWVDESSSLSYLYGSTVASTITGKRFILTGVTGPSSPITVNADINVTGSYKTQYYLSVSSQYGTTGGQGWYDSDATTYASLNTGIIDFGNGTRQVFTHWSGDASGTNYAQSNPIMMSIAKNAIANWKTQYSVTFSHSGLDSSASSTVVTVNGAPKTYSDLPYTFWVDKDTVVTYSYSNVSSSTLGKRFILIGVSGLSSPISVTNPVTIIGNYKIQYQITFNQSGVGSDFTGIVVSVDGTNYAVSSLPVSFWWDSGSLHSFAHNSPLIVSASKEYIWTSTSGLSTLQNGTLTVTTSGSVVGNYTVKGKYQITFVQSGVSSDFTDTVVIIDSSNYAIGDLPVSFWWDSGSVHNFAYQSPLLALPNIKQYVWTSTSGLSTVQGGSITVTASGTVTGNYKTQYYLTLATNPSGIGSPSGTGWYDANTQATISTAAFVDIIPGSSRYRFNGWSTADMPEITNPSISPTTVLMDKGKTVTANYVTQYSITFDKSGVGSDFSGTVVTVDSVERTAGSLPISFWWDSGSSHTFAFSSPLVVTANAKQYAWTSTSGLSTVQSGSITVTASGTVTGNYKTQYYLTVNVDPTGLNPVPSPLSNWYDTGTNTAETASMKSYKDSVEYDFNYWDIDGSSQGMGVNPISIAMDGPHSATAHYHKSGELPPPPPPPVGGHAEFAEVHPLTSELNLTKVLMLVTIAATLIIVMALFKRKSRMPLVRRVL